MELLNVMETALKEGGQRPAISTQPSATDGGQPAPEAVPGLPTHNHRLSWVWVSIVGFLTIAVVFFVVRNVFALIRPDFLTTRTSFAVASATNSQSQAPNLVPMNTDLLPTKATLQSTSITWMPTDTPEQIPTLPSIIYPSSDSPTGKIAFVCQLLGDEAEDQICLINSDGTNWQQLTNEADSKNYFPSISSDGNGVVYVSNRSGDFEIYEMDLSTRNSNQLTFGLGTLNAPEVSPDGQYIVFTNKTGGNMIWVMARDGKDPHQIFGLPRGFGWDPVWSPDGNKILFASGSVQKPNLSIMNADGSNVKVVLDIDGLSGRSDWSPDGQRIASYIGASWKREIITMNIDGSDLLQLTNGGNNLAPSFSPDGKWITFTSYRNNYRNDNGCEIYIMRIDGSDIRRLTNNSFCDYQPRWGP
jgi:Tol biopolymer transport system component